MRCGFIKADGEQCSLRSNLRETPDGARCIWHDPARTREALAARKRGGAARQGQKRAASTRTVSELEAPGVPRSLEDIADGLAWISHAVLTGAIDPQTAREATAALRALQPALRDLTLAGRVKALETELRQAKGRTA
jgi:hypothetical protein